VRWGERGGVFFLGVLSLSKNELKEMESTEIGMIFAGTVAFGLMAKEWNKPQRKGGVRASACHAMRSAATYKGGAGGGVSSKKATTTAGDDTPFSEPLNKLFESIDSEANASQLSGPAQNVIKMQKMSKQIEPISEMTTHKSRSVGNFVPRLGSAQWETNPNSMPSQTNCGTVGIPFNAVQEHAYEAQHGAYPEYAPQGESKGHPIDAMLTSVM